MVPTLGGVHKIQILIRDLQKACLQQIFGEEMGAGGGNVQGNFLDMSKENPEKSPGHVRCLPITCGPGHL